MQVGPAASPYSRHRGHHALLGRGSVAGSDRAVPFRSSTSGRPPHGFGSAPGPPPPAPGGRWPARTSAPASRAWERARVRRAHRCPPPPAPRDPAGPRPGRRRARLAAERGASHPQASTSFPGRGPPERPPCRPSRTPPVVQHGYDYAGRGQRTVSLAGTPALSRATAGAAGPTRSVRGPGGLVRDRTEYGGKRQWAPQAASQIRPGDCLSSLKATDARRQRHRPDACRHRSGHSLASGVSGGAGPSTPSTCGKLRMGVMESRNLPGIRISARSPASFQCAATGSRRRPRTPRLAVAEPPLRRALPGG